MKVVQFQFRKLMNFQNSLGLDCCTDPAFSDTIVLKNLMKPKLFGLWIVAQSLFSQIQKWNSKNSCTVPFKVVIPVQKIQKIHEAKFFGSGLLYRPSFARYTIVPEIHEPKFFGLDC